MYSRQLQAITFQEFLLSRDLMQEDKDVNLKIAQLKFAIDQNIVSKKYNFDWVFKELGSINYNVVKTEHLNLNNPQLIGSAALHFALNNKNLDTLNILLDNGADFTLKNENGSTALHSAIEQLYTNNSDVLHFNPQFEILFINSILTAHVKYENFVNPSDRNNYSHFHAACMLNYRELVEIFLYEGVCINDTISMDSPYFPAYTPLHLAARFFALETVEILLMYGANRNTKDARGMTPLQLLLEKSISYLKLVDHKKDTSTREFIKGRIGKIIRLFLEVSDNGDMIDTDVFGLSHFHYICTTQDLQLVESYLNKVSDINHCVNINSPLCAGYTALHFAAFFSIDNVKMLVKRGANLEFKEAKGMTPFDICVEMYKEDDIRSILLLHPVWKDITFTNRKKESSKVGLRSNSTKLVDLILAMSNSNQLATFLKSTNMKANFFVPMKSSLWPGFTPLHIAVSLSKGSYNQNRFGPIIKELYEHGADLNSQDPYGRTPLHLAFQQGKYKNITLLLSFRRKCKPINVVDENNLSHLHILYHPLVFEQIAFQFIIDMLHSGVNVDIACKGQMDISCITSGSTPLHLAVVTSRSWNHLAEFLVEFLVERGADLMAKDSNSMTPIHLALVPDDEGKEFAKKLLSTSSFSDSVVDDIQLSHLHVACYANHYNAVVRLIELGADVNKAIVCEIKSETYSCFKKFVGFTPLKFAVVNSSRKISELLVENGADILIEEPNRMTALYSNLMFDRYRPDLFASVIKNNVNLQKRIESEVGITMLHFAVIFADIDMMKSLLAKGANVNAQVFSDSPVIPGFTPLHVFTFFNIYRNMKSDAEGSSFTCMLKLLLQNRADVTLSNAAHDTPLHIICKRDWYLGTYSKIINADCKASWLKMLLQAHPNFDVNPINAEGISHFHLACAMGEVNIVKKFLQRCKIDINKQIDHFSKIAPGCTPLHLAIKIQYFLTSDHSSILDVIDLLLKCGAIVDVEDICGDTPLHDAVRSHYSVCEDFLERFVREAADVNRHNVKGETAFELLLKTNKVQIEKIKYFLKCGCRWNVINPVTGENYWATAVSSANFEAVENLILITSKNFPDILKGEEQGLKVIHNIVSVSYDDVLKWKKTDIYKYGELIQAVLTIWDIDDQDNLGSTALHIATKYFNHHGVSTLLNAGADINIIDSFGQSAFSSVFKSIEDNLNKRSYLTAQNLVVHVKKLLFCGLYVSQINRHLVQKIRKSMKIEDSLGEPFQNELKEMSSMKVGSYSLTLGDFLSELGAVSDYPTMTRSKRHLIDEFFKSRGYYFFKKYIKVVGLLELQYRKAQIRVHLIKKANASLTVLAGLRLPPVCSQIILKCLMNSELENLITSTSKN